MLENIRSKVEPITNKIGLRLSKLGMTPIMLSILAIVFSIISAFFYSNLVEFEINNIISNQILGSIFLLIAGLCDMLDGAIARVAKKSSLRGAFIDSTFDRVTEIIVFAGLLIGQHAEPIFIFLAITLSMLVSYARTKAEAIKVDLRGIGIAERSERILILCLFSFINEIRLAIIIITILSSITFIERFIAVMKKSE
ncbi:MAG: CDP-diacylglycerol--glycerol-3-phosphate 3-phosphatidyltransferase [Thaumarchaeota archaeon]|nr:CDP-diacylglycerol--glycerol-3-phosphate 3-phosphatidyltransferase [Nitrososphaerota archaeon]